MTGHSRKIGSLLQALEYSQSTQGWASQSLSKTGTAGCAAYDALTQAADQSSRPVSTLPAGRPTFHWGPEPCSSPPCSAGDPTFVTYEVCGRVSLMAAQGTCRCSGELCESPSYSQPVFATGLSSPGPAHARHFTGPAQPRPVH